MIAEPLDPLDTQRRLLEYPCCDGVATDQKALLLTPGQRTELDRRLDAYAVDKNAGRLASEVVADIRHKL